MNSADINELHKIWLKFLNTTKTEEGEVWLDAFLEKYLELLCNSNVNTNNCFSFQWRSSGNILAHQLLSDMYQICETVKSNSSCNLDSSSVSEPFKKYLLEGRGWKILWTLESIGIQNLLCLRDLIKLLVLHVPVLMSLPLCESTIPDVLRRKAKNIMLNNCFVLSKRNKIIPRNIKLCWPDSHISKKKRNYTGKKRIRRKKLKATEREINSSSEEDPILFEPVAIPASQLKTLQKVNRINPVPKSNTESEETELELSTTDSAASMNIRNFSNYCISVIDYMHFIFNLLQESALLDHRNSEYMSYSSPLILEFSLNAFKDLYNGRYALDDWPKDGLDNLQNQLLKIVFLSATVTYSSLTYTGAPNENEVVSTLLTICEEILQSPSKRHETVLFTCEAFKGCLLLIYNTIELYCGEFAKIVDMIRTFTSSSQNFYHLISYLDNLNSNESINELYTLINLIKDVIVFIKFEKVSVHSSEMNISHSAYNLIHHHNDVFGPSANFSIIQKEPVCAVAKLSSILLEVFNLPVSRNACIETIKQLKMCGICCCINPGYVMKTVFGKFSSYNFESQHYMLILVEKHLLPQLSLTTKHPTECACCSKRVNKSEFLPFPFIERLLNTSSQNEKKKLLSADLDIGVPFWNVFGVYNELLNSSSAEIIENLAKHLIQIFSDGISDLKTQLFMRVILPQFLELSTFFDCHLNLFFRIKSKCTLTVLQLALCDITLAAIFVHFEGINILYKFILIAEFRQAALAVLKILIFSEIDVYFEGKTEDIFNFLASTPASSTFCNFLLDKTQAFHQKLRLVFHSGDVCNTSTSTSSSCEETENMLGNLFDSYNPLIEEKDITVNEEEIRIICDVWKCYQEIISNSSNKYFGIISENTFKSGYDVFFLLLENLNIILTVEVLEEKPEVAQSLLLLIQNLLSVCINIMKETPKKVNLLEAVKSNLKANYPKCIKYLGPLFDFILKCCFSSSTSTFQPISYRFKTSSTYDITDDTTTSGKDGSDISYDESYCADTEGSIDSANTKTKYDLPYHTVIEHGEVVKLLIELLIHFQKEETGDWAESALHVMQILTKMCHDCELNKRILCNQGISTLLLESFAFSLKEPDENLKDYQAVTIELFIILSQFKIQADDLKRIINFFKSSYAPMPLLLKSLNSMIDDMVLQPIWSLSFPCSQLQDSNRIKKRLKTAYNIHQMYSVLVGVISPWSLAALCFPITEDTRWNAFNKGFSFTLWLKMEKHDLSFTFSKSNGSFSASRLTTSEKTDDDLFKNEKHVVHLISIGSDKFLLELWYDKAENDLEIRITSCIDKEVLCLSKGVCKSLLEYNSWHHIALNYYENSTKSSVNGRVQVVLDGIKENIFNWSFNRQGNLLNKCYVLLGHAEAKPERLHGTSTYKIGNFMLFKGDCLTRDIIFYLMSLGPNLSNITECAIQKQNGFVPKNNNSSNISSLISLDVYLGLKTPSLETLQNAVICCYSPEKSDVYLVYPSLSQGFFPLRVSFSKSGNSKLTASQEGLYSQIPKELQVLVLGEIDVMEFHGFQCAVQQAGGITIFLFLFAYILENSNNQTDQAISLNLILKLINKHTTFEEDFDKIKGYELLTQMIMSKRCIVSSELIEVFKQNCLKFNTLKEGFCATPVLNSETTAMISNGALLSLMLKSVSFSKNVSSEIITSIFLLLDFLLNPKSSKLRINIEQMNKMEVPKTLLWIIRKKWLMNDVLLPVEALRMIPVLMQKLLWYKFDGLIFQNICHLMLLHKSSTTYVCHSRFAFFYLCIVDKIGYEKRVDASTWYVDAATDFYPFQPTFPSLNREMFLKRQLSLPIQHSAVSKMSFPKLPRVKSANDLEPPKQPLDCDMPSVSELNLENSANTFSSNRSFNLEEIKEEVPLLATKLENTNDENQLSESEICIGLLQLINSFITKNNTSNAHQFPALLQPEIFIVLTYTMNSKTCASVLKVIHSYLYEANESIQEEFLKLKGFHLLANQLHQHPFNKEVFDMCFSFISGIPLSSVSEFNIFLSKNTSVFQTMSWLPLLSMLPHSYSNHQLCEKAILCLTNFLQTGCDVISSLLDNGLIMSISFLITKVCHSYVKEIDENRNSYLDVIYNLLKVISFELCSSKQVKDFYAFSDIVNIFTVLENRCLEECGTESWCTLCWRECLCNLFQIIFEFAKIDSFQPPKNQHLYNDKSSVWELLTELQESLGTFSTISVNVLDVQKDPSLLGSHEESSAHPGVKKAMKELPASEFINRLELLLESATHFVVFKDPRIKIAIVEKEFTKSLFNFCMKGLCSTMDRNSNIMKSPYSNLMCNIKDSLKKQLGCLLFIFLSPNQDSNIKEYVVDTLATHPLSGKILQLVVFTLSKIETLFVFLFNLQMNPEINIKKNALILIRVVKNILQEDAQNLDFMKKPQIMEKLNFEWIQLWKEDRQKWYSTLYSINEKSFQKFEVLAQEVSTIAFNVTQKVFEIQNIERKLFMEELKKKYYDEASERMTWFKLVDQMTHEKAIWYMKDSYPDSWELDPTEGPLRIRRRLKRCFMNIDDRFIRADCVDKLSKFEGDLPFVNLLLHQNDFSDSAAVLHRLHSYEQIQYTSPCKIVTAFEESKLEILIGAHCIHLIGEEPFFPVKNVPISESWPFENIKEIVPRRYELQNNAFEIFLTNGLTYLIAFESEKDFHLIWKQLEKHNLPCKANKDLSTLTQLWRQSSITNFEYLTQLNKLSGRSFNDLMQYPVFPFVLSDYRSPYLNLSDTSIYRNLGKPVAIQNKYREKFYMDTYEILKEQACFTSSSEPELPISGPYHYGSHYSNSGTILHFLIRILPFTYSFIKYQDNNFDIPDRTFHSMETSWQLVTKDSTSDVKELIPEFFFLPEFLSNKNGFDFGVRQSGIRVNDVLLPPWCKQNPRLFILIHRQILESDAVTKNIHSWIDLVFGYKQTGEAALNAINVFHPATYYGFDINQWKDPITKQAVKVMIKTLGQMPKQLFSNPHSMISLPLSGLDTVNDNSESLEVVDTVNGLRWGDYVGSPSTGVPSLVWCRKQNVILGSFLPLLANYMFGLGENICLLLNHRKSTASNMSSSTYIMSAALVSWGHSDDIIRIKLCRDQPAVPLLKGNNIDKVCLCASMPDCRELFVAHVSGKIFVYTLTLGFNGMSVSQQNPPLQLSGHSEAITCICICKPFSVFVSASKDKTVVVWDLNRLCYVRSLTEHDEAVELVSVSETLGDIASISNSSDQGHLKVSTINGEKVGSVNIPDVVTAVCYSTAPEGISVNVIATGLRCGNICLWSSWDLKPVREITCDRFRLPIKCIVFSSDNQHLFASNESGTVAVWEKPSKGLTSVPRFLIFT